MKSPGVDETVILENFNKPDYPVMVHQGQIIQLSVDGKIIYSYPVETNNLYYVQLMPVMPEEEDKIRALCKQFDEGETLLTIRQIVVTRTKKNTSK